MNDRFGVRRALERVGEMPREHRLAALVVLEKECQSLEMDLSRNMAATALEVRGIQDLAADIRFAIRKEKKR